jgi:hypothetical protein
MKKKNDLICSIKECGVPNLPKNPVNKRRTGNLKGVILCKNHTRRYLNIIKKEKVPVQSVDFIEEIKQLIAIQYRNLNCKHEIENLSSKNPATNNWEIYLNDTKNQLFKIIDNINSKLNQNRVVNNTNTMFWDDNEYHQSIKDLRYSSEFQPSFNFELDTLPSMNNSTGLHIPNFKTNVINTNYSTLEKNDYHQSSINNQSINLYAKASTPIKTTITANQFINPYVLSFSMSSPLQKKRIIDEKLKKLLSNEALYTNFKQLECEFYLKSENFNDGKKLNDEVINGYFKYGLQKMYEHVYVYPTFFFLKLQKEGFDGVKKWLKNVNLFVYEIILIPINLLEINHWSLLSINLKKKEINYYDSCGFDYDFFNLIKGYLDKLSGNNFDIERPWIYNIVKEIPQQTNSIDCGVFICIYSLCIASRQESFEFDQSDITFFRKIIKLQLSDIQDPMKKNAWINIISKLNENLS